MGKSSSFGSRSGHKLEKMPSDPRLFPSQQNESILKSLNTEDRVHIILKAIERRNLIKPCCSPATELATPLISTNSPSLKTCMYVFLFPIHLRVPQRSIQPIHS